MRKSSLHSQAKLNISGLHCITEGMFADDISLPAANYKLVVLKDV